MHQGDRRNVRRVENVMKAHTAVLHPGRRDHVGDQTVVMAAINAGDVVYLDKVERISAHALRALFVHTVKGRAADGTSEDGSGVRMGDGEEDENDIRKAGRSETHGAQRIRIVPEVVAGTKVDDYTSSLN